MSLFSGEMILSKMLDNKNSDIEAKKLGLDLEDFQTDTEKEAYSFLLRYIDRYGENPDWRTLMGEVPGFNYREDVQDSLEYLINTAKRKRKSREIETFMNKHVDNWGKGDVDEWTSSLLEGIDSINKVTAPRQHVGTNLATDFSKYLEEYDTRKAGKSFRSFAPKHKSMRDAIGNWITGNMYTWYGRSGRGKSAVTLDEACYQAQFNGANVLIWSMEMSTFEVISRAYSFISGNAKLKKQNIGGAEYIAGFQSNDLIRGKLSENDEEEFRNFLGNLNEYISGSITIRGKTDRDFHDRSVKALESDILKTKADIVVVDPFYLLDYEYNRDKTTGGAATATSQLLNRVAGSTDTVIFAITQAEEVKDDKDDSGERILRLPGRNEVKKTTALLEDAFLLIAFDSCDGRFQISLNKGRQGGEGTTFEGIFLPGIGYLQEPQREEVVKQFGAKVTKYEF